MLLAVAWELGIFVISPGLIDGGRSGLIYSTLWNFIGFAPVYLSMAEMASMAPIAGAQYHWVSEFAPESMQKPLSYVSVLKSVSTDFPGNTKCVSAHWLDFYHCLASRKCAGNLHRRQPDTNYNPGQRRKLRIPELARDTSGVCRHGHSIHWQCLWISNSAVLADPSVHHPHPGVFCIHRPCLGQSTSSYAFASLE